MPLLALTGPTCAGKNTIAAWLVEGHGYRRISIGEAFPNIDALTDYATKHWRDNLVTTDISTLERYEIISKRPFFLLIGVDAPTITRWRRHEAIDVLDFIQKSDATLHINSLASLIIQNTYNTKSELYAHLHELGITNVERIRPSWDAYFMRLAKLASLRSNCMKRRVGCVLVRDKRVISTGYNGTPRGLRNCNEGGCARCNEATSGGHALQTCLCLHAEENALLESGRDRSFQATLYCNTCPCLTCSVKIAQVGVKEVIYMMGYSMDAKSAEVLSSAGVLLRQYAPPYSID